MERAKFRRFQHQSLATTSIIKLLHYNEVFWSVASRFAVSVISNTGVAGWNPGNCMGACYPVRKKTYSTPIAHGNELQIVPT